MNSQSRNDRTRSASGVARPPVDGRAAGWAVWMSVAAVAIVLGAGLLLWWSQRANERAIQVLSTHYMEEVAARVWSAVETYLAVGPRGLMLIAEHGWDGSVARADSELEPLFRRLLNADEDLETLSLGFPDGGFLMVKRMPDGSLSTKRIQRRDGVAETVWQHDRPLWEDESVFASGREPARLAYDPRRRPWYSEAVRNGELIWSDPYVFYSDRMPGISCGLPLYGPEGRLLGVVAADLRIDRLSEMLRGEGRHGRRVTILTDGGEIVAHPDLGATGVLLRDSPQAPGAVSGDLQLRRLRGSRDRVMAAAFDRWSTTRQDVPFTFGHAGTGWVARFDTFPVHPTRGWIVGVAAPEHRLLGSLRRRHHMTLAAAGGCLLLSIGLVVSGFLRTQRERLRREQMKLERERRLNAHLQELDRVKNDFLANTTHELRTPLFGIAGLAEALAGREHGLPDQAKQELSLIISSARRLTALVNDVLDFSKLRHHDLALETKAVDLYAVADVVLALCAPLVGSKNLRLINQIDPKLPRVQADPWRLEQVLHNLIGNAVKFTAAGTVRVAAWTEGERVLVSVVDTGPGVPEADQERIFMAFEQDSGRGGEMPGTGLGLSVSRRLVELQGGRLWLESEPGRGATFRFTLPRWSTGPQAASREGERGASEYAALSPQPGRP